MSQYSTRFYRRFWFTPALMPAGPFTRLSYCTLSRPAKDSCANSTFAHLRHRWGAMSQEASAVPRLSRAIATALGAMPIGSERRLIRSRRLGACLRFETRFPSRTAHSEAPLRAALPLHVVTLSLCPAPDAVEQRRFADADLPDAGDERRYFGPPPWRGCFMAAVMIDFASSRIISR